MRRHSFNIPEMATTLTDIIYVCGVFGQQLVIRLGNSGAKALRMIFYGCNEGGQSEQIGRSGMYAR